MRINRKQKRASARRHLADLKLGDPNLGDKAAGLTKKLGAEARRVEARVGARARDLAPVAKDLAKDLARDVKAAGARVRAEADRRDRRAS